MKKNYCILFVFVTMCAFSQINSPNGNNIFYYNGAADVTFRYQLRGNGGRAFVHADGNILGLNFGGDFTGGTRIGNDVFFKDGGNSYIYSGNFGIGTTSPRANFDMAKDISNGQLGTVFGRLPEGDGSGLGTYLGVKGYSTQGTDLSNVKSFSVVHDFYGQTNSSINFYRGGGVIGGFMTFSTSDNTEKMRIGANGNVGIGTTNPDSKLTIKGKIHAEEVKIDLSIPAPDYVFANDYKLKTLEQVEEYIKQNSHLPEIPSAQEIEKNGLMLAEMNMSLLKKVEELTLYMIDFKKEIDALKNENRIQKEEIKILKKTRK